VNKRIEKWKSGLKRTRKSTFGRIASFLGTSEINVDTWDELEALLIQSDIGAETTFSLIEELQKGVKNTGITKSEELKNALIEALTSRLVSPPEIIYNPEGPTIIMVVGVNGSGKTTSVAKLGKQFQILGKRVLFAAADTFRAAAIEQLQSWGERLDIRVITGQPDGDPGAVTYDAIQSAISKKEGILLIDTAGRMHTKFNLMEELKKVYRVAGKAYPDAPHGIWLVMDATTGQNALQQAKAFKEAVNVTGIILAKLDSSARGGMAFAIKSELDLPILFAGLGEGEDDLVPFDPNAFAEGILADFNS
jgi:fused signal recognition particle receptor